jgi:acylphosphatase
MTHFLLFLSVFTVTLTGGCAVEASKTDAAQAEKPSSISNSEVVTTAPQVSIEVVAGSPADTVRAFYQKLREKKFREAIFLTNLRPAVEGLTDTELKEFQVDFERIASQIPAEVKINGEIVSGDKATVTASLPGEDPEKNETQSLELRKEGDVWVILTVDEIAEARIKREGKNYFYVLRIETHEDEARTMLDRIARAQLAYSVQNGGNFGEIDALVGAGLLPDDVKTAESTGYNYLVKLSNDKKVYTASATPAEYGKSGRLSFVLQSDGRSMPKISSKDNGGKPLEK